MTTTGLKCKKSDGAITYVTWKKYYARCAKGNSMCTQGTSSAYVAASTVCYQSLW
jgi:hypothetical protein